MGYYSPDSYTSRSLVSMERGWVSVYGVVISAYCYIILLVMSFIFLFGGGLLTGIAFRPQQAGEQLGEWTYRLSRSQSSMVAGPSLLVLGVLMLSLSVVLCHLSRRDAESSGARLKAPILEAEEEDHRICNNSGWCDQKGLMSDIACFPPDVIISPTR